MSYRWSTADLKSVRAKYKDPQRSNKYGAKKTVVDAITFDSKKEAARYTVLKLMAAAGKIENLNVHVPWELKVNMVKICVYVSDFCYIDDKKRLIVEDVKSKATRTPVYQIKKTLMKAVYNIEITET